MSKYLHEDLRQQGEAYSEPSYTFKIESFAKTFNGSGQGYWTERYYGLEDSTRRTGTGMRSS